MEKIRKKIFHDENAVPKAVLIDFSDWVEIEKILGEIQSGSKKTIYDFAGKINLSIDPLEFQKKIREEWI